MSELGKTALLSRLDSLLQSDTAWAIGIEQLVADMSDAEWLRLAGWDVAATFGPADGYFELVYPNTIKITDSSNTLFLIASLVSRVTNGDPLIRYLGTTFGVVVAETSPYIPTTRAIRDPKDLLTALQLIRRNIDTITDIPREERVMEVSLLVTPYNLELDFFNKLMSWFPQLERIL